MEPDTTKNVAYFVMALSLLVMVWFISKRAMKNRMNMLEASGPKIAGDDVLEGGARNPQQFDEPDDDALEEMAKLLGEDDEESNLEA
jgi:F0F1-type ATP synthase membrane subunit b/b'